MSETKAAFAERTIRSLKNILYCYMEEYGYRYIEKASHFVITLISPGSCSIDLNEKIVKNSDFLSILYIKPLREYRNLKLNLETKFASPSLTDPSGNVLSQSLHRNFFKLMQFFPGTLQYTRYRLNKGSLSEVNFIKKSWSKSFTIEVVDNSVGF